MGNKPSRAPVIQIRKVEAARKPEDGRDQPKPKEKPDDDRYKRPPSPDEGNDKQKDPKEKVVKKSPEKEPNKTEIAKAEPEKPKYKKKEKKTPPLPTEPKKATKGPKPEIFESVTDIPREENIVKKIIRLVGITQMSAKNFVILFILWSLRFFIPWVNSWWNFNKHILSDPSHLAALESYLFMHEILAFLGVSTLTVLLSVFADVFNLKYFIYLALIALFLLCPITGLVAINILWERGWYYTRYHEYAPTMYVMMYWAKSIPNVAYPVEFCCFFTQVDDMSREAHYNYAAIFVFLDSLNWLICFYVIPGECPTLQWTLASLWIVIGVAIHTLFLLSCFFIFWVKPANKVLNRTPFTLKFVRFINRILTKLKMTRCLIDEKPVRRLDIFSKNATPFMKQMKFILLGLVLVPIIFSSFVIAIMHRLEVDEHWDQHEFLGASSMFLFGRVIGVILISFLLFFLRRNKKPKFFNKHPIMSADVLALGLPHVIIILALAIIAGRFGTLHKLNEGDVVIGPIPDADRSVVEIYNADFRNRTVCVFSEKFRPVKVGPRRRETRKPKDPGVDQYEISVTIAPRTTPPVYTHGVLEFTKNSLITYVVALNSSLKTATDLEAIYAKFQLIRVRGTESVKPKKDPQLIIINSFMLNTSSYFITVNQYQTNLTRRIEVPPKGEAHVMDVNAGRIDVRYENGGTNNTQQKTKPILDYIQVENYTVWSIVVGLATAHNSSNETEPYNVLLNKYLIMEVAGPDRNPLPDKKQLQQDIMIMVGMCLGGIAEAGIKVGFIYLFWLDAPIVELRVTSLACFAIALAIPQEFPRLKLVDITTGVAAILLCLQLIFTVLHFIGATFLYDEAFNFRKRPN